MSETWWLGCLIGFVVGTVFGLICPVHYDRYRRWRSAGAGEAARMLHLEAHLQAVTEDRWAAQVNADESMQAAAEAWARCFELVEMVEGRRPADATLIHKLKEHQAHVVQCRRGSCEHEYAALVRAGLITPVSPDRP